MATKITALRVELDYNPDGRKDITVTADDGPHEYKRPPTRGQYKECFDKILEFIDNGTSMTFYVDKNGYLVSDP